MSKHPAGGTLRASKPAREDGFVIVLAALSMIVFVALIGFAVDLGSWYLTASKLQRAADAASLAAASDLPDTAAAATAANDVYLRNGFRDGINGITLNTSFTAEGVTSAVRDSSVPTYFLKMFFPNISMGRSAQSMAPSPTPVLGSPFNVLGTGNLKISGLPSPQDFWLAVNGVCSPKEDGDYFDARYDHTKGSLTNALDASNNYVPAANGRTHCPSPNTPSSYSQNLDYEPAGYSYFIDVPKPPASAGSNASVNIKVYDPALDNLGPNHYSPPDFVATLPQDHSDVWGSTAYDLFDTRGTPENPNDDVELLPHPYVVGSTAADPRFTPNQWWTIYTIPYSEIANGGQFRVQVTPIANYPQDDPSNPNMEGATRGTDSFSIGAFASWESGGTVSACNTDNDTSCPRVYGLNSMSVFNNVSGKASGSAVDFYLANITPQFVGQTFDLMLWDPGEGTQGIQLVAPDGTPLNFTYTSGQSFPGDVGPSSSSPVNIINTGATDNHAIDPATGLPVISNDYVFNDRLVTITVTIPPSYTSHVVGNDNWLRLRYIVNSNSPNDRTTWGLSSPGAGAGGPVHLTPAIP